MGRALIQTGSAKFYSRFGSAGLVSDCIALKDVPHTSRLFADYLGHSPKLRTFYPSLDLNQKLASFAPSVSYSNSMRETVATALERQNRAFGSGEAAVQNIERLRRGAFTVVSGQQVGLFGGPLLAILKAAHAVRLARDLSQRGIDSIPVFWMASEDHDFAEVNHVELPQQDFSLRRLTVEANGTTGAPMSEMRLEPQVKHLLNETAELLGETAVVEILRESYRPGETMAGAFGKLFARLFAAHGLVLLDPADADLHRATAPLFRRVVGEAAEIARTLQERGKALEHDGYHEQVKVSAGSVLLFAIQDGARVAIERQNSHFSIGKEKLTQEELLAQIEKEPEKFNANVLLRPVMQDTLLPTLAYIGGPAEVAYFGQASVVYQRLLGRATPILPRFSATLIEPKIEKLLERYDLQLADLYHGSDALAEKLAQKTLSPELDEQFRAALAIVTHTMAGVKESVEKLDPTLVEAAERATSKMRYQVGRLHRRAARALLHRTHVLSQHANQLVNALYPEKSLQERTVGAAYFVSKYGVELIDTLVEAAGSCPEHRVIRV
jgi:bacillithiol biosynthesis cysteine-adding enzyme BshC